MASSSVFSSWCAWSVLASVLSIGCSARESTADDSGERARAVPSAFVPEPFESFDRAKSCAHALTRFSAKHDSNLGDGVVQWTCAPRADGLSSSGDGTEFCEYKAVALPISADEPAGKGWKKIQAAVRSHSAREVSEYDALLDDEQLACVFSTTFHDAKIHRSPSLSSRSQSGLFELAKANVSLGQVAMRHADNSRGRASRLLTRCAKRGEEAATREARAQVRRVREAACYLSVQRAKLSLSAVKKACDAGDLSDDAIWNEAVRLGVRRVSAFGEEVRYDSIAYDRDAYELQQDTAACLVTESAEGTLRRQSDLTICSRAYRLAQECGEQFSSIPADDDGFELGAWDHREKLPENCTRRFVQSEFRGDHASGEAQVDEHLVVCTLSDAELIEAQSAQFSEHLGDHCRSLFAERLVVTMHLREKYRVPRSSAPPSTPFCNAFAGVGQ